MDRQLVETVIDGELIIDIDQTTGDVRLFCCPGWKWC